jgi:hypothetical protein
MHKYVIGAVAILVLALAACGGPLKYKIKGTAKSPELDADIVANVADEQGLTMVQISAQHLAPPDRFANGGSHFVAWAKRSDGGYGRIGALKYDKDKRTGMIEATSPDTSFVLLITAETQVAPKEPSANVVLEQKVAK